MTTIEQINTALSRYYKSLNQPYDDEFLNYCDENGVDDELLDDEIMGGEDESMLVQFDNNFPFDKIPSDRNKFIASVLQKCYINPQIIFES